MKWFFEVIEKKEKPIPFREEEAECEPLFPFNVGHILLLSHSLLFHGL